MYADGADRSTDGNGGDPSARTEADPGGAGPEAGPPIGGAGGSPDESTGTTEGTEGAGVGPAGGDAKAGRRGLKRFIPPPLLQIGRLLIIALIVEYLVLPQIAGTRKAIHTLSQVSPLLLLLGFVLEATAICAYAQLTRTVLPPETDPGFFRVLRIQLTTLSVSHCVPGGSAAGSSLGYRLLSATGVDRTDVGFALATQSLGSAVVLNGIFWLALVVSIPVWGFSPLYLTAAAVGLVLVGGFVTLVLLFTRGEERAGRVIYRVADKLPLTDPVAVRNLFVALGNRMKTLAEQRATLFRAVGWAAANWLFDAASLFVFVGAFGHWVNPVGLLVSYGLANVLAAIPLTPGGLGVVEATLTFELVGFGTSRAVAILGVVAYRLVNFWLPIPVGGLSYLSLQVGQPRSDERWGWAKRAVDRVSARSSGPRRDRRRIDAGQ